MAKDLETREEYIQLSDSCDFLEHYHLFHSDDIITRFRGKKKESERSCDIYVVSDPGWKEKFRELTRSEFPEDRPRRKQKGQGQ